MGLSNLTGNDIEKQLALTEVLLQDLVSILQNGVWTFSNDVTITSPAELKGNRFVMQCGRNASFDVLGLAFDIFLKTSDGVQMAANKGIVATRAGSLTGVSINYDVSGNDAGAGDLVLHLNVNGTNVFSNTISETVATNKTAQFTQSRASDTFVAGDIITISLSNGGELTTISLDEVVATIEGYYDT